jgi:hypothetical protein
MFRSLARSLAPTLTEKHTLAVIALGKRRRQYPTTVPHPAPHPHPLFSSSFDATPPALAHLIDIVINQRRIEEETPHADGSVLRPTKPPKLHPPHPHTPHATTTPTLFLPWLVRLSGSVAVSISVSIQVRDSAFALANTGGASSDTRNGLPAISSFGARRAAMLCVGRCVFLSRTPKDGCSHLYAPITYRNKSEGFYKSIYCLVPV